MMVFLVIFLLLLSIVLEGIVFALPLVLALLIILQITYRSGLVVVAAFISGVFLDALLFRPLGQTSLFFLFFLILLILYEKRFEVQTYTFLLWSVIAGTTAYLVFFGSVSFFAQEFLAVVISLILFFIFMRKNSERNERMMSL